MAPTAMQVEMVHQLRLSLEAKLIQISAYTVRSKIVLL